MNRRQFVSAILAAPVVTALPKPVPAGEILWTTYVIGPGHVDVYKGVKWDSLFAPNVIFDKLKERM